MIKVTNLNRYTVTVGDKEIERKHSAEFANDKWDELRKETQIRDMLMHGKLTAEKVKKY